MIAIESQRMKYSLILEQGLTIFNLRSFIYLFYFLNRYSLIVNRKSIFYLFLYVPPQLKREFCGTEK
jgi:hypothetical protein